MNSCIAAAIVAEVMADRRRGKTVAGLHEILGLGSDASPEQIAAAITAQRRTLRRRATSPDIAIRQAAELAMQQLSDAERGIAPPSIAPPSIAPPDIETNSIARAVAQLECGQHGVAVFTARRAVQSDPDNAYAWSVLAQAASASSDHTTATDAIERALDLEPEDARLHALRGAVLRGADEPAKALAAYQAAASLQADEPEYQVAMIEQLIAADEVDRAITTAQQAYREQPDEGVLRTVLARALARRAYLAQHELADGRLLITTPEQARYVESLAGRGLSVEPTDPELYSELIQHRDYARRALRPRFSLAALKQNYKWPLGVGLLAVAVSCCIPNALKPETEFFTRIFIVLLALGGLASFGAAVLRACFRPQYQTNAAEIEQTEPRRMGQVHGAAPKSPTTAAGARAR
ncbi:MAG: hypothetical protein ACRDPW_09880 [Mycobacteriales bacterium]